MRALGIAIVALTGCDGVFNLDHVTDPMPDALTCPDFYNPIPMGPPGVQYRLVPAATPWVKAADTCEQDQKGHTHLVVFDTSEERVAVEQYAVMLLGGFSLHGGYGRDTTADAMTGFVAVTGEPVPNTQPPWKAGEPNNGLGGGPEPVVWFGFQTGLLDGPLAGHDVGYVCECDHRAVTKHFDFQP
jgi:hypothetical protein